MTHLIIHNHNESYVRIQCEEGVAWELRDDFSFRPPNFQFVPSYKAKLWDGYLRLFNINNGQIYRGLAPKVAQWAYDRGYTYEWEEELETPYSVREAEDFIKELNPKHKVRDYQMNSFVYTMRHRRGLIISPTGSGKSLLQYMVCMKLMKQGKKGLLIVSRADLVEQMYTDFVDYSVNNGKNMAKYCHRVYSGRDKHTDLPICISTWQSFYRMPKEFFEQFDYVIVDEVHLAKAKSLSDIVSKCTKAVHKIGVTGTLTGSKTHEMVLIGLFGQIYVATTSKELMDRKELADLTIKCLLLKYSDEECRLMKKATYQQEIEYIISHNGRNQFITNLALSLKGNTLLLFNYVDKHGRILYDMINKKAGERKVFFIHGGVDVDDREQIRKIVETETDAIIVGSVGCLATGTNIVNLDNIIFASPSKARVRNLQSIGRVLRVSDVKKSATLFDIADNFGWKRHENFSLRHFYERLKIYTEEKFSFKIYKISLTGKPNENQ